eukprot:CAMPEP_0167748270 /NCGR_PEP_ID=MMETSP0110_2-20121227/4748_1 /TAXON_ID=629695 /ORGANISM="Gymnochlora sp., Strain CCMP2014" /LENGTH=258 /DNA_ID=CAMNT_0007633273 /DNA_START=356 /DNA_END=1129 /DNA_ORIENTATION=-
MRLIQYGNVTVVEPRVKAWGTIGHPIQAIVRLADLILSVDSSNLFGDLGGFNVLHAWIVDTEDEIILTEILKVMGISAQNNPICSRMMVKLGLVETLSSLLKSNNTNILLRVMSPLSSLSNMDPEATLRFINCGGLKKLLAISISENIQIKEEVLYLLDSLATEAKVDGIGTLILEHPGYSRLLEESLKHDEVRIRRIAIAVLLSLTEGGKEPIDRIKCSNIPAALGSLYLNAQDDDEKEDSAILIETIRGTLEKGID